MDSGEKTREQLSALADGELDATQARHLLARMGHDAELRAAWDHYHQIGDAIRSEDMIVTLRPDFSERIAARLDAELPLLAPKRTLLARLGAWPTALAAAAAAGFGFFIAPEMFGDSQRPGDAAVHMATNVAATGSVPVAHGTLLAEASGSQAVTRAGVADYIRLHRSAHPALYGTAPLSLPLPLPLPLPAAPGGSGDR